MADDAHPGLGVAQHALGKGVQDGAEIGLDVGPVDGKGNFTGNVELELVVGGLRHLHPGATGAGLHLPLLLFHAGGPDVAADGARTSTNGRTAHGPAAAVGGRAQHGAGNGADGGTAGGAFLLFRRHVGAASQHQGGQQGGCENALVHTVLLIKMQLS